MAALIAAAVIAGGAYAYRALDSGVQRIDVSLVPGAIPADGVSSALLEVRLYSRFGHRLSKNALPWTPVVSIDEGANLVRIIPLSDSLRYRLVAGFDRGRVVIHVRAPGLPAQIEEVLLLTPSLADRDGNGYPDALDLTSDGDRTAFRRWFVAIALGQLEHLDDRWTERDCAGLLRYCYREALKQHDSVWRASRRWLVSGAIPDVHKYNYPNVPIVGTSVFRTGDEREVSSDGAAIRRAGLQDETASRSGFAEFAEASVLKDNSLTFVGRDPSAAEPGDVLFYLNDTHSAWPYHTMIYAGNGITVYHTGPDGDNPGIVKRMSLAQLGAHPNPRWHPATSNPYFLGFYRWRILN